MPLTFKHTSILSPLASQAIVIPVNCIGVPGAGLARQWAYIAPSAAQQYRMNCMDSRVHLGKVTLYRRDHSSDVLNWWITFPTKYHWADDSKMDSIRRGLCDLTARLRTHKITSLALPMLGAGLGNLDPAEVKELLVEYANVQIPDVDTCIYVWR